MGELSDSMRRNVERIGEHFLLTSREMDVLTLYALGHTQKKVAEELFITPATAHSHIKRIYSKCGMHSRQEILELPQFLRKLRPNVGRETPPSPESYRRADRAATLKSAPQGAALYLRWLGILCAIMAAFCLGVFAIGYKDPSVGRVATLAGLIVASAGFFWLAHRKRK